MVVTDPRLVSGGAAGRFDPAQEPLAMQRVKGVVNGLQGDMTHSLPYATVDGFHVEVVALPYGLHDRQTCRGHP